MGYYSDVVLMLDKESVERLAETIETETADMEESEKNNILYLFNESDKHLVDEDGIELFAWNGIKWNEGIPNVDFFMDFIDTLDNENYQFIKIGEDDSDIVRKGWLESASFNLSIRREIVYDIPDESPKPC